jgi:predicted secreted protein
MSIQVQAPGACDADVDEPVVISLEETPTTGYQWEVVDPPADVEVDETRFDPPTSPAPGAAGRRVITVRATAPGAHRLRVQRRRAWEPAAAETLEVVVNAS